MKSLSPVRRNCAFVIVATALMVASPLSNATAQSAAKPTSGKAKARSAPAEPTTPYVAATVSPSGKKILSVNDYAKWRNIDNALISSDGKWVSYGLRFTNTSQADSKPELHIYNQATGRDQTIANATNASFSPDSRFIVYQVDMPAARGGRGGGRGNAGAPLDSTVAPPTTPPTVVPPTSPPVIPPVVDSANPPGVNPGQPNATTGRGGTPPANGALRRFELRELATGRTQAWQDMQSAIFSPTSSHLLMRRRAANAPAPGGGGRAGGAGGGGGGGGAGGGAGAAFANASGNTPHGTDALLLDLATTRSQFLGSVGEISFNKKGDLLAYTVDATGRDGNGLFLLDMQNGRTEVLDNDARNYNHLTWTEDGTGVAVLKARDVDKMREHDNALIAFPNVRASLSNVEAGPARLEPSTQGFPKGFVISDRASLVWSGDNKRVFLGIIAQGVAMDTARHSADSVPDVDVWRTQDERIQSVQITRIEADRNFTYREGFDVSANKYVPLTDSTMRDLELSPEGKWAVGRDTRGFISDYKRPAADIYRVNTTTGERTLMLKAQLTGSSVFGISPDGTSYLYWKDNKFQTYNLDAATTKTIAATAPVNFVDMEYDHPGPKPSYGIAGYTSDGQNIIAQSRYDLWLLPLNAATPARSLTNGIATKDEVHYRYVRTDPIDPLAPRSPAARGIDLTKPITLSAYGEYTKKDGFYELNEGKLRQIVYEDVSFSTPVKAAKADQYLFTRQTFAEFPDLRTSNADFKASKKISNANPQQADFAWGHRVLFDFKNKDGLRLQGILALPDDYKPGEKRPMMVNFYEANSQNMHHYSAPSFLTGMGSSPVEAVSRGYITMLPDVHFHTGSSHSDMLDCVEAATRKVIEMGYADPKHIGVNGHSYGGEGAAFIGTRSRLFAAVGMGAGVTDLFTDFSQSWGWSYQVAGGSGANGNDYYLYGQGRWGVSPWDNPDLYHFESALTHVREVTQPFLIMHGTADPTVSFSEGMNFYNALRYNNKDATLLAYIGEGHGLRGLANRRDLTIRFFQYFDHYLKGAPAPKWMTEGVPFMVKNMARDPG
ncbi:MAG: prolyl oligopeptidase family serine peptidase [Gemmatimonadaceae bacterium]